MTRDERLIRDFAEYRMLRDSGRHGEAETLYTRIMSVLTKKPRTPKKVKGNDNI